MLVDRILRDAPMLPARDTRGVLCVLAKLPRRGHVKTRLARSLGDDAALELATAFLDDTLRGLEELPQHLVLALDQAPTAPLGFDAPIWMQGTGTLGARIERVLQRALRTHEWAIALGSDSPGLPRDLVARAGELLDAGADSVLGPCLDGGFYLLGVRQLPTATLRDVRWSSEHACADTERALHRQGLRAVRIDSWFDVDEAADLEELRRLLDAGSVLAPRTATLLGCA